MTGMTAEVDRLPVRDLMERYSISKTVLYERIKALQIKTQSVGRRSYVSGEQIALLDGLHDFLRSGRSTAEFLEMSGLQSAEQKEKEEAADLAIAQDSANQIIQLMSPMAEAEPSSLHWTDRLRFLEEAYQHHWLLSTSQLAEMLGITASTLARMKNYSRFGFEFSRAGMNGSELAWKIYKLD